MSNFRIRTLTVGEMGTNCYILYREGEKSGVVVDPGANKDYILTRLKELSLIPEAILLTHGHFDHIGAVEDIKRAFPGIKVYAGEEERQVLEQPEINLTAGFGRAASVKADEFLKDGEEIVLAGITFQVLFTPGHTCGSVCYYVPGEEVLISGDTLFCESLGRSDFPTGSAKAIVRSITERLFALPDQVMVYPGHGEATAIGHEKQYNPAAIYKGQRGK